VAAVRDRDALRSAADRGVAELGRLDIVSANAAITSVQEVFSRKPAFPASPRV